jgi:hypothetical protein
MPLVYIAKSNYLVDEQKDFYNNSPSSSLDGEQNKQVEFLTYAEFLNKQTGKNLVNNQHDNLVEFGEFFQQWFNNLANRERPKFDPRLLYQEFRIIAGCGDQKEYERLGAEQSQLEYADKQLAFKLFNKYKKHVMQQEKLDLAFYDFGGNALKKWDLIVVDESQDLSLLQLKQIYQATKDNKVVFCIDINQSLYDSVSTHAQLKTMIYRQIKQEPSQINLEVCYRMSPEVINGANNILSLKRVVSGGKLDKSESVKITALKENNNNHGQIKYFNEENAKKNLENIGDSTDYAVVVLNDTYRADAKDLFGTQFVFTVEEIKGLEFKNIVGYKLFEDKALPSIEALLPKNPAQLKDNHNKKKTKVYQPNNNISTLVFNELFVAFTRAQEKLYIVVEKAVEEKYKKFFTQLRNNEQTQVATSSNDTIKQSTPEQFAQLAAKLQTRGLQVQAEAALKKANELKKDTVLIQPSRDIDPQSESSSTDESSMSNNIRKYDFSSAKDRVELNKTLIKLYKAKKKDGFVEIQKMLNDIQDQGTNLEEIIFNHIDMVYELYKKFNNNILPVIFHRYLIEDNSLDGGVTQISSSQLLSAMLYGLSSQEQGREILWGLIQANTDITKKIKINYLCEILDYGKYKNVSILYHLVSNGNTGTKILKQLLEDNPRLMGQITVEALCVEVINIQAKQYLGTALLELAKSKDKEIFFKLLATNQSIPAASIAKVLCQIIADCQPKNLAILCDDRMPKEIIEKVIGELVDHAQHKNLSLLYHLSANRLVGLPVLNQLFNDNPDLIKHVTLDVLCTTVVADSGQTKGNVLTWLAGHKGDRDYPNILYKLITKNPNLAAKITGQALCQQYDKENKYVTPLHTLSEYPLGVEIIQRLLSINEHIAEDISIEALCTAVPEDHENGNTSPIYCLSLSENGGNVLKTLITKNKILAEQLPMQSLRACVTNTVNEQSGTCPFYWLLTKAAGREFLQSLKDFNPESSQTHKFISLVLKKSPEEIEKIFRNKKDAQKLTERGKIDSFLVNPCAVTLKEILVSDYVYGILDCQVTIRNLVMPDTNKQLVEGSIFYAIMAIDKYVTSCYEVLLDPYYLQIMKNYLAHNNYTPMQHTAAPMQTYNTILCQLAMHEVGLKILNLLIENNPHFAKHITIKMLNKHEKYYASIKQQSERSPTALY